MASSKMRAIATSLLLGSALALPAFCPARALTTCKRNDGSSIGTCTPTLWHGIDSLELFEIRQLNRTAVHIRSLNNSFVDTVGTITIQAGAVSTATYDDDDNPLNCFTGSTAEGNCTTHITAHFSDLGRALTSTALEACGTILWPNGFGLYGAWTHADLPRPSPPAKMCDFDASAELYHEVGTSGGGARFFTLQRVNATAVRVHSLNQSFPDTVASLYEVSGKIAFRATLFGGNQYRGIMRSNGDGTPGCCKVKAAPTGTTELLECPVISWWSDSGDRSCWETALHPAQNEGACTE